MDINQFRFSKSGYGQYIVLYMNDKRGDYYISKVDDMSLIDNTLNSELPKKKHLNELKCHIRRNGVHYSKHGEPIENKYNC